MERDMRKQLFEHYEKLSFSYYSTHNSGQMMSKLVSDLFDISELAHHGPENLFISLVKIIGSFVFLFLINQKLALPLLLLVILMILFSIRQNKKMQQTFLKIESALVTSMPVCRIRSQASVSFSPLPMRIRNCTNLITATRRS